MLKTQVLRVRSPPSIPIWDYDGTGIRAVLRTQILGVRLSLVPPIIEEQTDRRRELLGKQLSVVIRLVGSTPTSSANLWSTRMWRNPTGVRALIRSSNLRDKMGLGKSAVSDKVQILIDYQFIFKIICQNLISLI